MSELRMTLNQIRNETRKAFEDGYDHPEDMSGCTNSAGQEFVCCGDDCSQCSGNNECRTSRNTNGNCSCCSNGNGSGNNGGNGNGDNASCMMNCPNENLESCIYERRWEMTEHTAPVDITDENGSSVQYIKIVRIIRNYRPN